MHLEARYNNDPPIYDDLHAYLIEAVGRAARQLRQEYIEIGVWPGILLYYQARPQDVNSDGNTVEGLAWTVREELGWPLKIDDPREPQRQDAERAVLHLVTLEELLEVVTRTALDAGEGETIDILEGEVYVPITEEMDNTDWQPAFGDTEAS